MKTASIINPLIKTLTAFSTSARTGSFTQASKVLGIPQKSVTRNVLYLEQHLGVSLFIRERGKLHLTLEGSELYHAISSSLAHIMTTVLEISQSEDKSTIVVGCPQLLLSWVSRRLKSLKKLVPSLEIELVGFENSNQDYQIEMDIIFAFGMGKWVGFESYLLFEEEVFPVCSPAFAEKFSLLRKPISVDDLSNLPLIHGDWDIGLTWQSWFACSGVEFRLYNDYRVQSHSYLICQEKAIKGDGIALAWTGIFQSDLNSGVLEEIPGLRVKTSIGFYMLLSSESSKYEIARQWWRIIS